MVRPSGGVIIYPGISVDPQIVHGKPVIAGTRVLVSRVLGHLAAGDTIETIGNEYDLTPEQIRGAIGYAASLVASEEIYVVANT